MKECIEITLLPHFEPLASVNPFKEKLPFLLEHQLETIKSIKDNDIVFNLSTTGTGKTLAALLGLLNFPETNALIIAPTNALVSQHKRDSRDFVGKFNLPHLVEEINAERLNEIEMDYVERRGEKLYRLLSNPLSILEDKSSEKRPFVFVTNPDIFYYAIFYLFNPTDKRNLAQEFMTGFDYIVIDELHYYNAKQFANFLYFIILSYKFGFFEKRNRKIIILTATPDLQFRNFIDRLKALSIKIKEIEPNVSPSKPSIQVLSELKLNLLPLQNSSEFPKKIEIFIDSIKQDIAEDKDGLIISSSLRNINKIANNLHFTSLKNKYARITGPIPREEREKASLKPLVLATPTVDIGYNFVGRKKNRQNIDFGYFHARYLDQFWQRLGRIGRVLGKSIQNISSDAYAFIPEETYFLLEQEMNSFVYKREEFKELLENIADREGLMRRDLNPEYISYFSLLEIMLPLKNIYGIVPEHLKDFIEETFETIKSVYSPKSNREFWNLFKEIKEFEETQSLISAIGGDKLNEHMKGFKNFIKERYPEHTEEAGRYILDGDKDLREDFLFFLRNRIAKYEAMFKFRGGGIELSVAVYDPESMISESQGFVKMDFLHLIRNYEIELFTDEKDASEKTGIDKDEIPQARLYAYAKKMYDRSIYIKIQYRLPDNMTFEDFDRGIGDFAALNNLKVVGYNRDNTGETLVPMQKPVKEAFSKDFITGIILPSDFEPSLIHKCRKEELYPSELEVTSVGKTKSYFFFIGTDAHEFFSKYGWSLKKLNPPAFIA